ncbi:hypothetical protein FRX31_012348, partial [Thalictrum thalictroides]
FTGAQLQHIRIQPTSQILKNLIHQDMKEMDQLLTHMFHLEEALECVQEKSTLGLKFWSSCTM